MNRTGPGGKLKLGDYLAGPAGGAAILIAALALIGSGIQARPASHRTAPRAVATLAPAPSPSSPAPVAPAASGQPSPTATASGSSPAPAGEAAGEPASTGPPVPGPPSVQVPVSSTVAYLNGPPSVEIYSAPGAAKPTMTLKGHNSINQAQAFLVVNAGTAGWYQV
ncbi:MAG: hypothetical protein ACRDJU_03550, partial [Actinomycetota bacterium]